MKKRVSGFTALYAVILIAALALTALCALLCRTLAESRSANYHLRSTLAYTQTRLEAADTAGGVRLASGPEGTALLLAAGDSGYETRIYLYDGALREELSPQDQPFDPEHAQILCAAESFSVTEDGGLFLIQADGMQARAALHAEGGDANAPS